ncbi:hypothetical protein [Floccifex sp.]|uniref:hypothetical protein n=1 Tax=Floccifex sp. TaxID=2815810 RepID=UPI003EFBC0F0
MKIEIDHTGIIHCATLNSNYSNIFRLSVTLIDPILPEKLQIALNQIVSDYPTIVARIQKNYVLSVQDIQVQFDEAILKPMTIKEIETCAIRILYKGNQISVEFFHAITDGYGGLEFIKALILSYIHVVYEIKYYKRKYNEKEFEDSYLKYANHTKYKRKFMHSFQIPWDKKLKKVKVTSFMVETNQILEKAHEYQVTMTTFLTALLIQSILEFECIQKPIQIMVSIDLRKKFESKSLRNFSLYALVCVQPGHYSFEELIYKIQNQLNMQYQKEYLQAMISSNVCLEQNPFVKKIPYKIKLKTMKGIFRLLESKNSTMTLTNLGKIDMDSVAMPYVQKIEGLLSPRIFAGNDSKRSPYNFVISSFKEHTILNFSRMNQKPTLEIIFFKKLKEQIS